MFGGVRFCQDRVGDFARLFSSFLGRFFGFSGFGYFELWACGPIRSWTVVGFKIFARFIESLSFSQNGDTTPYRFKTIPVGSKRYNSINF